MATTMIPGPSPSPGPGLPSPALAGDPVRFVAVRANLMPGEVLDARQADVVRRRVLIGLAGLLAVLIAFYGMSWLQTSSSNTDRDDQVHRAQALTDQEKAYAPLIAVQGQVASIGSELSHLMAGDIQWRSMTTTLRAKAPAGIGITTITANVTAGAAGASAATSSGVDADVLNDTGKQSIGTLTISGTTGTKQEVASYADRLGTVKGITAVVITNYTATTKPFTFTITALMTTDALGGRFATPATTTPAGTTTAPTSGGH